MSSTNTPDGKPSSRTPSPEASASHKELTRELKRADPFQARALQALDWIVLHQRTILLVAIPLVVFVAGAMIWQSVQNHRKESRMRALAAIDVTFQGEAEATEKIRDGIRKTLDALPAPPTDPKAKEDPAVTAKREAINKQISDVKPDHSGSTDAFVKFHKENANNQEGWTAGLRAADQLIEGGKIDQAREIVAGIVKNSSGESFVQVQSRLLLLSLLEDAGDFDGALKEVTVLEGLLTTGPAAALASGIKPGVLLSKARLQILKGAKSEAAQTLDGIVKQFASDGDAAMVVAKARSMKTLVP